jgi:hypothetical protein
MGPFIVHSRRKLGIRKVQAGMVQYQSQPPPNEEDEHMTGLQAISNSMIGRNREGRLVTAAVYFRANWINSMFCV